MQKSEYLYAISILMLINLGKVSLYHAYYSLKSEDYGSIEQSLPPPFPRGTWDMFRTTWK